MEIVPLIVNNHFIGLIGLTGSICIFFALYWLFDKKSKERHLAILREQYLKMQPTDPEYNQVRALYTAMMIDAKGYTYSQFVSQGYGGAGSEHSGEGDSGGEGGNE